VITNAAVSGLLEARGLSASAQRAQLCGIADEATVYEIR
jgi:hypothetical protein